MLLMKKIVFFFVVGMLVLIGCLKYEIIFVLIKKVELIGYLIGNINGIDIELIEGVDNYVVSFICVFY